MIHVVATITVHPGRRADFLGEFRRMMPATLAEDGCIAYAPLVDVPPGVHHAQVPPRPDVVTIVERWRDLDALRAHLVAPHMADYRARVKDLVAGAQLQILGEPA
jgi:quinol monooxygenase YgiN